MIGNNQLSEFMGMRVIESAYLMEEGPLRVVRRTWRERLWSRPWRPWQATRTERIMVPRRTAVVLNDKTVVMHPEMARLLRAQLRQQDLR